MLPGESFDHDELKAFVLPEATIEKWVQVPGIIDNNGKQYNKSNTPHCIPSIPFTAKWFMHVDVLQGLKLIFLRGDKLNTGPSTLLPPSMETYGD